MFQRRNHPTAASMHQPLRGRRVELRPLVAADFDAWREVRLRNHHWLTRWEPARYVGAPDAVEHRDAFAARCDARAREIAGGSGHGFGVFVADRFAGEVNLSSIQRGPFQNAYVGYWIDQALAGNSYIPEAVVAVFQFAFESLRLHRLQISIIPRNAASNRVVEKLGLRFEGVAVRYLEIDGRWEDHGRFAITAEEWAERRSELLDRWIVGGPFGDEAR